MMLRRPVRGLASLHKLCSRRRFSGKNDPTPYDLHHPLDDPVILNAENVILDLPKQNVRTTVLPNGLRVVSFETYDQIAAVGAYVRAGSRCEAPDERYSSHMLERMAFQSTAKFSADAIRDLSLELGGKFIGRASRDDFAVSGEGLRGELPRVLDVLSDTLLRPLWEPSAIAQVQEGYADELFMLKEDPEKLVQEAAIDVAFRGSSLGRPQLPPSVEEFQTVHGGVLNNFCGKHFRPEKMTVSAVGVDHAEFVDLVNDVMVPKFKQTTFVAPANKGADPSPAVYRGGDWVFEKLERPLTSPMHIPPLTYIFLGFEGVAFDHPDYLVLATIKFYLGGGSSFSAGGPGKGMYSRLYRSVMCKYGFVQSINASLTPFPDTGLFGLIGSTPLKYGHLLAQVMANEVQRLRKEKVTDEELMRARNQLKSRLLMDMESRALLMEDMARQVTFYGRRRDADELCAEIDRVTADDIMRVAQKVTSSTPTVAVYGQAQRIPFSSVFREMILS
jgi:processing peptidase subunit alpha